jgi:hypothetical protein
MFCPKGATLTRPYRHNSLADKRVPRAGSESRPPTMGYATLRKLYALVVMLAHDFTPETASAEVEHHAAFRFVEGACADIPRYDSLQGLLPLAG